MRILAISLFALAAALPGRALAQEPSPPQEQTVAELSPASQQSAQADPSQADRQNPVTSAPADQGSQTSLTTKKDKSKDSGGDHKIHFRWGGITVGAGYSYFSNLYYPYYPYYGFG